MGKVSDWLIGMEEDAGGMSQRSRAAEHGAQNLRVYDEVQEEMAGQRPSMPEMVQEQIDRLEEIFEAKPDPVIMCMWPTRKPVGSCESSATFVSTRRRRTRSYAAWRRYMYVKRLHRKEWSMSQDSKAVVCSKKLKFSDWDGSTKERMWLRTPTP